MHLKTFKSSNKAVGTIFGMIFFLLIVAVVFAGFAVVLNQSIALESSMVQTRQLDNDKAKESLVLNDASYDGYYVSFTINNTGVQSAQVVRLWVQDLTLSSRPSGSWSVPLAQQMLLPNDEKTLGAGSHLTIPGWVSGHQLRYWFVTARGNQFTFGVTGPQGPPGETGPQGPQGGMGIATGEFSQGPFILLFNSQSFTYTADNSPPTPNNPAGIMADVVYPQSAFQIDNDNQRLTFNVQIKNGGNQTVEIGRQSFFLVEVRQLSGGGPGTTEYERYFHIVESSSAYDSLSAYSPDYNQIVSPGQISTLKFAASSPGGTSFLNPEGEYQPLQGDSDNGDGNENLCWSFLVLFWRYQGTADKYGATISYFAIQTTA